MKHVSAYYFRSHMYTLVPRHVREDMEWMADLGTDAVVIGVLEQDLFAAVENIQTVAEEAERVGMKLYMTPSRWGSLVAGCPKVPSTFSSSRPEVWSLKKDGTPHLFMGPLASVHHPATLEFFVDAMEQALSLAPISGIIWDEPKALEKKDTSPMALEALKGKDVEDINVHIDAQADFFDQVNQAARTLRPDLDISMFVYGHLEGYLVDRLARIPSLNSFGLDGRPYRKEDGGGSDSGIQEPTKFLCDQGPRFIEAAHRHGKDAFMLIENHAMKAQDIDLMDQRLPEVLALGAEHICYYYYPRSVTEPDRAMQVIAKHLSRS